MSQVHLIHFHSSSHFFPLAHLPDHITNAINQPWLFPFSPSEHSLGRLGFFGGGRVPTFPPFWGKSPAQSSVEKSLPFRRLPGLWASAGKGCQPCPSQMKGSSSATSWS